MGAITRQFGWLCPLVQSEAACYAQHLRDILVEPEMQRLLAEVPQATRILKPVLHMLGIRLDRLALEATPQLVAAPAVAAADLADRFWAYEPGFLDLYRGAGVVRRENG